VDCFAEGRFFHEVEEERGVAFPPMLAGRLGVVFEPSSGEARFESLARPPPFLRLSPLLPPPLPYSLAVVLSLSLSPCAVRNRDGLTSHTRRAKTAKKRPVRRAKPRPFISFPTPSPFPAPPLPQPRDIRGANRPTPQGEGGLQKTGTGQAPQRAVRAGATEPRNRSKK